MAERFIRNSQKAFFLEQEEVFDGYTARKLSARELRKYEKPRAVAGWRIPLSVGRQTVELDFVFDNKAPFSLPRIFLIGRSRVLEWPHVEKDNKLCVVPQHWVPSLSLDGEVARYLIERAHGLLQHCMSGKATQEFVDEFQNYWLYHANVEMVGFWSVVNPTGPCRSIAWAQINGRAVFFEDKHQGARWLRSWGGESGIFRAPFLWLDTPLYPSDYPNTNSDVLDLARRSANGVEVLRTTEWDRFAKTPILFGFESGNGPALGGLWTTPPVHSHGPRSSARTHISDGFRKGRARGAIVTNRFLLSSRELEKTVVQRCDAPWVMSRGGAKTGSRGISEKRVLMIGCGSLGGNVGHLLAQSGVGQIDFADPDFLSWDNVARHILGGSEYLDQNKAAALKRFLERRFPTLRSDSYETDWMDLYEESSEVFYDADVIVSTTADWPSNAALNTLARRSAKVGDIVFGWTEEHALAGHALLVKDLGGCLVCGCNHLGRFQKRITEWEEQQLERTPACGGFYQPYGSMDLAPIQAMIAKTVAASLRCETDRSQHNAWIGDSRMVKELGGSVRDEWKTTTGTGERVFRRNWAASETCELCR